MIVISSQRASTFITTSIVKCTLETVGGKPLPLIWLRTAGKLVCVNAARHLLYHGQQLLHFQKRQRQKM